VTTRVLALDVGDRRIGLAVSDPLRLLARPLATHVRTGMVTDVAAILSVVRQEAVGHVVVGLPLLPSGDHGEQAAHVIAFMTDLAPALAAEGVPWSWWDESYTTLAAAARRRERGGRIGRAGLDAEAAAVILEEWLRDADLASPAAGDAHGYTD
jgi:putative holliday junction resolvase